MKNLLPLIAKLEKPLAWSVLLAGLIGALLVFPLGILTKFGDDQFWITLIGFFLLILDGYAKVVEAYEKELDDDEIQNSSRTR